MEKVQLEFNLQIIKLQFKAQPSTLLEVKKQLATIVIEAVVAVDSAIVDCMQHFEQSFEVLKNMQEDPNVQ